MGRKTRNKITAEDEYIKEKKEFELSKDDHKENKEKEEIKEREKIYFSDLFNTLFEIFYEFRNYDQRLEYVGTSNIMKGPIYNLKIIDDESIINLIDTIMNQIEKFLLKSQKYKINDDDDHYYIKIFSKLNKNIIYSRIGFVINKWYIGEVIIR